MAPLLDAPELLTLPVLRSLGFCHPRWAPQPVPWPWEPPQVLSGHPPSFTPELREPQVRPSPDWQRQRRALLSQFPGIKSQEVKVTGDPGGYLGFPEAEDK